jgi:hypothetical protein
MTGGFACVLADDKQLPAVGVFVERLVVKVGLASVLWLDDLRAPRFTAQKVSR